MGKRKHHKDDSYEYIAKKLKKLERKLKHTRKGRHNSASSSASVNSDAMPSNYEDGSFFEIDPNAVEEVYEATDPEPIASSEPAPNIYTDPVPSTSHADQLSSTPRQSQVDEAAPVPEVDSAVLELLGDDPSVTNTYGKEINADLAVRLQHIATSGLSIDVRKELQGKYPTPSNCINIDAPMLNPEIKAALIDIVVKRDRGIEVKQKVLGSAISCLGEAISVLLNEHDKNTHVIKLLMDASRLICDCQNTDSITRRNFVLYNLKKDMKEQIRKTKIDNYLFGSDLPETLKTAKIISKSGADLKITSVQKTPTTNQANRKQPVQTTQRSNLNWKAPPPARRFKTGTQRMKEPTQRSQHASSYRPSYRPQPPAHPAAQRGRFRP